MTTPLEPTLLQRKSYAGTFSLHQKSPRWDWDWGKAPKRKALFALKEKGERNQAVPLR